MSPEATAETTSPAETATETTAAGAGAPTGVNFPEVRAAAPAGAAGVEGSLELLKDVTLRVKVELGRGKMFLRDVLRLAEGSVVELEKLAGDPLEIFVNERLVARGEVLVLNENFCVRITQIFSPEECLRVRGTA